jgi:hypothetical protein
LIKTLKSYDKGQNTTEMVEIDLTEIQKQILSYSMSKLGELLMFEASCI